MLKPKRNGLPEEVWKELLIEYRASIPEKLKSLQVATLALQQEVTVEHLEKLRFIVHKIGGSAAMYGYSRVSELCLDWQRQLDKLIRNFPDCIQDLEWQKRLSSLFDQFHKEFLG